MASARYGEWDGRPPNPKENGWHWLGQGDFLSPAYWSATSQEWSQGGFVCGGSAGPDFIASTTFEGGVRYVAPCPEPNRI